MVQPGLRLALTSAQHSPSTCSFPGHLVGCSLSLQLIKRGWPRRHATNAAAQDSALRRAMHLVCCPAAAVLKFLTFLTGGPAFSFCTWYCKLCSWSRLQVKGAACGPWDRLVHPLRNLQNVESCSSVFRVSASALATNTPSIPKKISASLNTSNPQVLPGQTSWKRALFSKYVLTEIAFQLPFDPCWKAR